MRFVLAASLALTFASPALADTLRGYAGLTLSPRGDRIAAIETAPGAKRAAIVVRDARSGQIVRSIDPCGTCSYSGLTFAPDGSLAWLARDRAAGTVTLSVDSAGKPHTIATVKGIAQAPRFSPDGSRIALLVTIGAAKESGAVQAGVRQIGEIGEANDEQRIAVFPVRGAAVSADAVKPVSPADRYVYEYDWTPDGRGFVVTSALGNGDANWWVATLDAVDAATGTVRTIARPATQINFPRVSPDGRTVAYIGGLMSDFGSVGGDVWTVPFAGGTPVDRTPGYKASVTSLAWTKAGLRGTTLAGANTTLVSFPDRGEGRVLWAKPVSLSAGDGRVAWSADGRIAAAVSQDFEHAPAILAGAPDALAPVTHDNDTARPIVTAKSVTWKSGGYDVQGWLLAPVGADPAKKAPMIVNVHGGPAAASTPGFMTADGQAADFINAGYYLFLPNPRGSYGQGEAFTAANKRDFGGGDLKDILAGIDAVERQAPVDDARLGLTGGSYGGFMAMWANTQTNRFKAIVAGAGLSNWVSYYGTNGINTWMIPFFGKSMYDDPAAYEKVSAINYIKQARTPTFIYVGERDIEVPPTQSIEYWNALKSQNVPTSLVIYPDEGHGIRQPDHVADLRKRLLAWFNRYLQPAAH
ncbi:Peptidase S9 [Sphingomonas sp. EC-HK361]|uniref:S9 family peptidase n=1 Tax=Sphingomonas sp. EC-HK361 TaxID=2038397 RepID=UPI0012538099|nr:S9 family peptidase [Sphingomonas sp. EC-HK361]VVS97372.1 Peptidase S9 [Sphingomonas sp. EC-HK361]